MTEFRIERNKFKRILFLIGGFVSVAMGFVGIFVPVWPTTIFLIIAAWCFVRSSEKYYQWLIRNRVFGRMIRNYREFRGIEKRARIKSVILLWVTMSISILLVGQLWIKLLLIAIGIAITWHLFALRTLSDDEIKKLNERTI